jgi:hypothetical protein
LNDPYAPPGQAGGARCGISAQAWRIDANPNEFAQHFDTLGVTNVRFGLDWAAIETSQNSYNWNGNGVDNAVNSMLANNTQIVGIFVTIPPWNTVDPASCSGSQLNCRMDRNNPSHVAEFRQFAQDVVRRYPRIRHWEFWNEPDMWENFRSGGSFDPALYTFWLNEFYNAAKSADSGLTIAVAAPLGGNGPTGVDAYYQNGAQFDAVTFHPYGINRNTDPLDQGNVLAIRNVMVSRGDSNKNIWLTEYGFSTTPCTTLSYAEQAQRVQDALSWIFTQGYIEFAHLHMLHDIPPPEGPLCMGLTGDPPGFSPLKDAYDVFQSLCTAPAPNPGGRCQLGTGLCSPTYLSQWFTGCRAEQASVICNVESGGNPNALNTGCLSGRSCDYSVGLFQINLLPSSRCPGAFSSYSCNAPISCNVANQTVLNQCVANFQSPDYNANYASSLSGAGTDWDPWAAYTVACRQVVDSLCP